MSLSLVPISIPTQHQQQPCHVMNVNAHVRDIFSGDEDTDDDDHGDDVDVSFSHTAPNTHSTNRKVGSLFLLFALRVDFGSDIILNRVKTSKFKNLENSLRRIIINQVPTPPTTIIDTSSSSSEVTTSPNSSIVLPPSFLSRPSTPVSLSSISPSKTAIGRAASAAASCSQCTCHQHHQHQKLVDLSAES
ncbi:unnamed protein product [Orchesella dallaii]|uniref:Uncharacterized protein n=1 Tax=Orchesella dallaii TaxID=48710 RepID=A0ABP1PKZ5_9HEXA